MKPHQLIPGDRITTAKGGEEIVRGVYIMVQLADGDTERHLPGDDIAVLEPDERPEDEPRAEHTVEPPQPVDEPHPPVPSV